MRAHGVVGDDVLHGVRRLATHVAFTACDALSIPKGDLITVCATEPITPGPQIPVHTPLMRMLSYAPPASPVAVCASGRSSTATRARRGASR